MQHKKLELREVLADGVQEAYVNGKGVMTIPANGWDSCNRSYFAPRKGTELVCSVVNTLNNGRPERKISLRYFGLRPSAESTEMLAEATVMSLASLTSDDLVCAYQNGAAFVCNSEGDKPDPIQVRAIVNEKFAGVDLLVSGALFSGDISKQVGHLMERMLALRPKKTNDRGYDRPRRGFL